MSEEKKKRKKQGSGEGETDENEEGKRKSERRIVMSECRKEKGNERKK